jgi:hypothetical protein
MAMAVFISPRATLTQPTYTTIPLLGVSVAAATNYDDHTLADARWAGRLGLLVSVLLATLAPHC